MSDLKLRAELHEQASRPEIADDLAELAAKMSASDVPHLSKRAKKAIASHIGIARQPLWRRPSVLALSGSFAAIVLLVVIAQSAQPGSVLYALKRGTENARATVDPGFKKSIVDRREKEVDDLKKANADDSRLHHAEKELETARERAGEGSDDRSKDATEGQKIEINDDKSGSSSGTSNSGSGSSITPESSSNSGSGSTSGSGNSSGSSGSGSGGHGSDD